VFPLLERGTHAYLSTLLRLAQQEWLLTFHEDQGRDVYRITTRAGRTLTLTPDQVVPFCEGLCAAHAALADEPLGTVARAIDEGLGTVSCSACRAPNPKHALRCRICGQRLLDELPPET
jgi:ribosomal protein L40E